MWRQRPRAASPGGARGPLVVAAAAVACLAITCGTPDGEIRAPEPFRFVFTADPHYGLTRAFRGDEQATASTVNRALVAAINALPDVESPAGHPDSGRTVGPIEFVAVGGDIATRQETAVGTQPAGVSWREFQADYLDGVQVRTRTDAPAPVFVVPGNHDASNAIGFHRAMTPATDPAALVAMFNLMVRPQPPRTPATYDSAIDRVTFSRTIGGAHFVFLHLWPDSAARTWMARDLAALPPDVPVILAAHVQPDGDAKHFRNPNGDGGLNAVDLFENLLSDTFRSGTRIDQAPVLEAAELEAFLLQHPSVAAYFHGHANWNEFYTWTGPAGQVSLPAFRADSPMRGAQSGPDETRLSFQVVTVDPRSATMTVSEYLWNPDPLRPSATAWGTSVTVGLDRRSAAAAP